MYVCVRGGGGSEWEEAYPSSLVLTVVSSLCSHCSLQFTSIDGRRAEAFKRDAWSAPGYRPTL